MDAPYWSRAPFHRGASAWSAASEAKSEPGKGGSAAGGHVHNPAGARAQPAAERPMRGRGDSGAGGRTSAPGATPAVG
eukprot:CAMPEP_0183352976 /NCGR_PEP_ID=MMETSP0164_2-20130417/31891_1 /TAXON_ID=221442 /ORGANISM="Coccolithus pelagicus ssp braarudi, Strain PLY182g" /LENGTH=77 /DNA_ID=CAMNT_0025525557 /DNA_START=241 /DNA_END=471 /DNA_ORIENTATION=-